MRRKWLIVDGIDGAGKSSFCRALVEHCRQAGYPAILLSEPNSSTLAPLLAQAPEDLPASSWALLFSAARAQLWQAQIRPALAAGLVVISDRGWPSTLAYQGAGDGLTMTHLLLLQELATEAQWLEAMVIVLDLPVEIASQRLAERGDPPSHWEMRDQAFQKRVRREFQRIAARYGYCLDARKPTEELVEIAWKLWTKKD